MKAARIYGAKDVRIVDVPIPKPKANQVQIKVAYNGICGSDLHAYLDTSATPQEYPNPLTGHQNPTTLGHEFSGIITKVGSEVSNFTIGDAVTVEPEIACGKCEQCFKGNYNYCENIYGQDYSTSSIGLGQDGGMAEFVVVDAIHVFKLPASLSLDLGALTEPTAIVTEAILRSKLTVGKNIAIMGAGPIGLLLAIVARISGASTIFISDTSEDRLQKAKELGFTEVYNPISDDINSIIFERFPSGVDITYDCAGIQSTLNTAFEVTKSNGVVMAVAIFGKDPEIPLLWMTGKGITLMASIGYANIYPMVIDIINNHQDQFKQLITRKIALENVVKDGFEQLITSKKEMKILIDLENK